MLNRLTSIIKFIASGLLAISAIMGIYFTVVQNDLGLSMPVLLLALIPFIGVMILYMYYLVKTGKWNYHGSPYSFNLLILLGLFVHLAVVIFFWYKLPDYWNWAAACVPFALIGSIIGIYDGLRFYKLFSSRT